jgi:ABC-type branched-subunit amino acid transport system ATPase component
MSGARLDLDGVGKSFRGLRAVHDVSFGVPAGAIHALIGPNGAGKTTIFNMIAGVFARHRLYPAGRRDLRTAARSRLTRAWAPSSS